MSPAHKHLFLQLDLVTDFERPLFGAKSRQLRLETLLVRRKGSFINRLVCSWADSGLDARSGLIDHAAILLSG